ncbi:MAG: hemolysin III family protein [Leptospiraceae bacterium]|nr:hemolysin III family protein [Leptospiraceae bacterium]
MVQKNSTKKSSTSYKRKVLNKKEFYNSNNLQSKSKTKNSVEKVETENSIPKEKIQEIIEIIREYSMGHEIANAVTHGIGGGLSIAGLSILVTIAAIYGDVWRVVSSAIYGATLVMLYLASTLYHGIYHWRTKQVFKIIDHAAIYLLIAGTYTPFTLVSLRENSNTGWILFGIIWGLALTGVAIKAVLPGRFSVLSVVVYIIMGWLCLFALGDIRRAIGFGGMVWLVSGGLSYTLGVIFYAWNKLPFNHAIWHLFVLGGSICHFFAILFYVLPLSK